MKENTAISCDCEEVAFGESNFKTKYDFGHNVVLESGTYTLTGLGGSGIHSFHKVGKGTVVLFSEEDLKTLPSVSIEQMKDEVSDILSFSKEPSSAINTDERFTATIKRKSGEDIMLSILDRKQDANHLIRLVWSYKELSQEDVAVDLFSSESIGDKYESWWKAA